MMDLDTRISQLYSYLESNPDDMHAHLDLRVFLYERDRLEMINRVAGRVR